jgi:hypothetical protein
MRPTVTEQLSGLGRLLAEVVAPEVDDPYAADVLAGAITTLELLAEGWLRVPSFLRWDVEATRRVLQLVQIEGPPDPDDPLDLAALHDCDRRVRELLTKAMPEVMASPEARSAVVALFRARSDRFPIAASTPHARPLGGPVADPAR